jgi:hypothetical protein
MSVPNRLGRRQERGQCGERGEFNINGRALQCKCQNWPHTETHANKKNNKIQKKKIVRFLLGIFDALELLRRLLMLDVVLTNRGHEGAHLGAQWGELSTTDGVQTPLYSIQN